MPLDGLRAWIGEVERKLGMRTRVFLVLAALAIGGAGAAIYLALDTRDAAVSEGDVRALQEDLEAQIAGGGTTATPKLTQLEADLRELEAKVEELQNGGGGSGDTESGGQPGPGTGGAAIPEPGTSEAAPAPGTDNGGAAANDGGATDSGSKAEDRVREAFEDAVEQPGGARDGNPEG
jgi:hypothetical protein